MHSMLTAGLLLALAMPAWAADGIVAFQATARVEVDATGKPMLEGGGTLVLQGDERWRGPGHNGVLASDGREYMVHHTYDVQNLGAQRILQVRPLTWTGDGWPRVGPPVTVR